MKPQNNITRGKYFGYSGVFKFKIIHSYFLFISLHIFYKESIIILQSTSTSTETISVAGLSAFCYRKSPFYKKNHTNFMTNTQTMTKIDHY